MAGECGAGGVGRGLVRKPGLGSGVVVRERTVVRRTRSE